MIRLNGKKTVGGGPTSEQAGSPDGKCPDLSRFTLIIILTVMRMTLTMTLRMTMGRDPGVRVLANKCNCRAAKLVSLLLILIMMMIIIFGQFFTSQNWNFEIWIKIELKLGLYFVNILKSLIAMHG